MSKTALRIIELVKSLPPDEQKSVCAELARHASSIENSSKARPQRLPDGSFYNPEGIPDDDPFFKIMQEQELARGYDPGPPPPELD